jgi:hypothetical protein
VIFTKSLRIIPLFLAVVKLPVNLQECSAGARTGFHFVSRKKAILFFHLWTGFVRLDLISGHICEDPGTKYKMFLVWETLDLF